MRSGCTGMSCSLRRHPMARHQRSPTNFWTASSPCARPTATRSTAGPLPSLCPSQQAHRCVHATQSGNSEEKLGPVWQTLMYSNTFVTTHLIVLQRQDFRSTRRCMEAGSSAADIAHVCSSCLSFALSLQPRFPKSCIYPARQCLWLGLLVHHSPDAGPRTYLSMQNFWPGRCEVLCLCHGRA